MDCVCWEGSRKINIIKRIPFYCKNLSAIEDCRPPPPLILFLDTPLLVTFIFTYSLFIRCVALCYIPQKMSGEWIIWMRHLNALSNAIARPVALHTYHKCQSYDICCQNSSFICVSFQNVDTAVVAMSQLRLTKPAPNFSGTSVTGGEFKDISLSDYKGKYLVFFFYPLDLWVVGYYLHTHNLCWHFGSIA